MTYNNIIMEFPCSHNMIPQFLTRLYRCALLYGKYQSILCPVMARALKGTSDRKDIFHACKRQHCERSDALTLAVNDLANNIQAWKNWSGNTELVLAVIRH